MARFSGANHKELINHLRDTGSIKTDRIYDAMMAVERGDFTKSNPCTDAPQSVGYSTTISAPHMHAHALELLSDKLQEGSRALDVGSGTGYLTVCMALMCGESGKAVGIDHIQELVESSVKNVKKQHYDLLTSGRVILINGEGRDGYAEEGPYDAIHVGAAPDVVPQALLDQLKPGGRLVLPVGPRGGKQVLQRHDKSPNGKLVKTELMNVIYGSLTSVDNQCPDLWK
ncbi:protein-L-isoaspartate(D-aspartate) O-methyltransferase-like [Saccoglossus kowalevskii]|uniref:protein-L-isoaspartate(D-aspartate) O-methyltransferase n=1 Tax=Saccoglossus kowalevskii TaxID=10224 RepID=A0ABM0MWG4_SACKO|nr:PREDICTED: protein-L-isoaspartate(D-aspartate) O-methyltransferase-like [Saccoglossus kowalevskii]